MGRRPSINARRSLSEAEREFVRQQTIIHLTPENKVSEECINLWADRKLLEMNPQLVNQMSTDLSTDQSASTSFESNTEPVHNDATTQARRPSSFLEIPPHSADVKRQKYRNLLISRNSRTVHPEVSSFESAISSESSVADSLAANRGNTSFDSTRSEATDPEKPGTSTLLRQESGPELRNYNPGSSNLPQTTGHRFVRSAVVCSPLARRAIGKKIANTLQRDYGVDPKTDQLFREFVRIDPKFEVNGPPRNALCRYKRLSKQRTFDSSEIGRVPPAVPLICFPEEQTPPR